MARSCYGGLFPEFEWVMTSEEQWEELKSIIEEGDIKPYSKYVPEFSIDYCKGFDAALEWVEGQINWLEEK